jgi:hypothetical protein
MTNTELLKVPRGAAPTDIRTGRAAVASARPVAAAPAPDHWAEVKTLLEIGFAIVRVVEIAILFA